MRKAKKKSQAKSLGSSFDKKLSDNKVFEKNGSNSENFFKKKFQITGLIRPLALFVISGVAYAIAYLFTKDMQFLTANIVSLLIALTVFWGVGLAMDGKSKYGGAIVVFLFLIFGIRVSTHYFVVKKQEARAAFVTDSIQKERVLQEIAYEKAFKLKLQKKRAAKARSRAAQARRRAARKLVKTKSVRTLSIGTISLYLKKGETSEWFVFPKGEFHYNISSPTDKYLIIFTDGTQYKGWIDESIPLKTYPKMKIKSLKSQVVTITVR